MLHGCHYGETIQIGCRQIKNYVTIIASKVVMRRRLDVSTYKIDVPPRLFCLLFLSSPCYVLNNVCGAFPLNPINLNTGFLAVILFQFRK